jgi:hypothetical protein
MSSILVHIHLGVINHVIIRAHVEFYTRDDYNGHSMTPYHLIDIECFLELDDLVCNPLLKVLITYRLHGNVDDTNE